MVSVFHLFRRRLMLPLQIFLGVFILGVWFAVPKIEKDLTQRAKEVIRKMDLEDKVWVSFFGPVATLSGKVEDAGTKQKLIDQVGSLVSVWGLQVENQQALVVAPPPLPITYRLDFASRQIKVSGSVPGELEKKALLRKVKQLFPKAVLSDDLTLHNQGIDAKEGAGIWLNLLDSLERISQQGQLRWVTVEEGRITVSANLPNPEAESAFVKSVHAIIPQAQVEDLHSIPTPTLDLKFAPNHQLTLTGTLASEQDQTVAVDAIQALFGTRLKITPQVTFDEKMGPVEWVLPLLRPLPGLQKLGKLLHVAIVGPTPLIEAEAINASSQISLYAAIEEAYQKNAKANVSLFTPVVNTITPPSLWVKIGEDESEVTGMVVDENGRKTLMTKLRTLFPTMKFNDQITINPRVAPTGLYAPALDPMLDIPTLESTFILQSFGLVEGRLKFTGLVPETAAKDRLTGIILKRHTGKVGAEVTVDPSYLPAEDAQWTVKFSGAKLTVTGQFSSKQLKNELSANLQSAYPGWEVDNQIEVLPSGLRKGAWEELFPGLPLVAAPMQTTQISWQNETLTLSARVPSEDAKLAMEKRLHHTYGGAVQAQITVVEDPLLRDAPAVALIDCTIYFEAAQRDFVALELPKLERVLAVLQAHPELKLSIEAHTDNKGSANINLNTSQLRADTVRKWLLRRQVDPARIVAKGYGSRAPVAGFKTEGGRAANRRMEFRVR